MAAPCAFWAKGNCKNGDRCRFEHIGPPGGGGGSRGGGAYEPRGGNARGGQRGGRVDHYEPRPPAQHHPDNYREPQAYAGRGGGRGGYQGGYQGGRLDDRIAYQPPAQRGGYQGAQPARGPQNDYDPRGGRGGRGRGGRDHRAPPPTPAVPQNKYLFDKDTLYADLTSEIPGWILSSYCPGTKAPVQLFGGEDREKSFEEMRLNHYMLREQGQEALAAQQQDELVQKALAQNENARNNVEAAVQYVLQGENEHPNRIDIADQYTHGLIDTTQPPPPEIQAIIHGALPSSVAPPAPAPQPQNVDAFGRPVSQQGHIPFGAPSAPAPAQFGQQQGAFGQPPQNTNPLAPPPFGQPQQTPQLGGGGAFGQPAQQHAQNPFGAPPQQESPFRGFNQPAQNVFGQQPQQQQTGAFESPAINGGQNPLSSFNQSQTQHPQAPNPFNSMSTSSATPFPTPPSSFQPQQEQQLQQQPNGTNPFGNRLQNPPTPQSSPFSQQQAQQQQQQQQHQPLQQQQAHPLSQAQTQAQQPPGNFSAYGRYSDDAARYAAEAAAQPVGNGHSPIVGTYINVMTRIPFPGPWTDPSPYKPGSMIQHPHVSLYSSRDPQTGRLLTFKDVRVEYRNEDGAMEGALNTPGMLHADGTWEKIWFPDGPPRYNPDTEVEDNEYTEEDEKAYAHLEATGRFPNDRIPRNPPKRVWCNWCF